MPTEIFDPTRVTTGREFALGQILWDVNRAYLYVKAGEALTVGGLCVLQHDGDAVLSDQNDDHGPAGYCHVAIANDSYGWLQVAGPCAAISVAANIADNDETYTTNMNGQIDDAAANALVTGVSVDGRTTAGNTTGYLMFPAVSGR